jgi:hypothetical protein
MMNVCVPFVYERKRDHDDDNDYPETRIDAFKRQLNKLIMHISLFISGMVMNVKILNKL